MANTKFYAVRVGKNPGVYYNWPDCQAQVNGFKGAIYKSFPTLDMAKDFVAGKETTTTATTVTEDSNRLIAFVDGSFNLEKNLVGYGVYLNYQNSKEIIYGSFEQQNNGRNVEGEVAGSLAAARYAFENKLPITLYYDYEGIKNWATGAWRRNLSYTAAYHDEIQNLISEGLDIEFVHVKAHTGIDGNEYVDKLAKFACEVDLSTVEKQFLMTLSHIKGFPEKLK